MVMTIAPLDPAAAVMMTVMRNVELEIAAVLGIPKMTMIVHPVDLATEMMIRTTIVARVLAAAATRKMNPVAAALAMEMTTTVAPVEDGVATMKMIAAPAVAVDAI
jgi:hypothetical protein